MYLVLDRTEERTQNIVEQLKNEKIHEVEVVLTQQEAIHCLINKSYDGVSFYGMHLEPNRVLKILQEGKSSTAA